MKNQINIDGLFQKAANQPVESSFGETKDLFLSSVGKVTVDASMGKAQVFTLKKGIIMIVVLSSIAVSLLLLNSETKEESSEIVPLEKMETEIQPDSNTVVIQENFIDEAERKEDIKTTHTVNNYFEKIERILSIPPEKRSKKTEKKPTGKTHFQVERPTLEQPYIFPKLNEKQIAENHKRKKKMVKAVVKLDKKEYSFIPSGAFTYAGIKTSVQAFVMQTTEVTNIQYKTFLFDLLIQDRKDEFLKAKPDQAMWVKELGKELKSMQDNYFANEEYDDYPVNNISREGAEMYCKWLTLEVNKISTSQNHPPINDIRLPLRTEWTYAASSRGKKGIYPWGTNSMINEEGCFLANFNVKKYTGSADSVRCVKLKNESSASEGSLSDGATYTAQVDSYNPNENGLYNMSGNVAEMVYENFKIVNGKMTKVDPGTAGGGWMSSDQDLKMEADDKQSGLITGHPNVGFRVVMTYLNSSK